MFVVTACLGGVCSPLFFPFLLSCLLYPIVMNKNFCLTAALFTFVMLPFMLCFGILLCRDRAEVLPVGLPSRSQLFGEDFEADSNPLRLLSALLLRTSSSHPALSFSASSSELSQGAMSLMMYTCLIEAEHSSYQFWSQVGGPEHRSTVFDHSLQVTSTHVPCSTAKHLDLRW